MEAFIEMHPYRVYLMVMLLAALFHWGWEVKHGRATADFIAYWCTETPGYSFGTVGALLGIWWLILVSKGLGGGVDATGVPVPVWQWHMIIEGAFFTGLGINHLVSPGTPSAVKAAFASVADRVGGFIRLSMLPWLIVLASVMFLAGCPGAAPRNQSDGAAYARATLNGVYGSALYLRKAGRLSDADKKSVLGAGASIETVVRLVEDGGNPVQECIKTINGAMGTVAQPPLLQATSCLDAAIQGLTTLNNLMEATRNENK